MGSCWSNPEVAPETCEPETQQYIATSRFRLDQASTKYKKEIFVEKGQPIPFNETADWNANQDHWFQLSLDGLEILKKTRFKAEDSVAGLFTTRMPRGITPAWRTGEPVAAGMTDYRAFKMRCQENNITTVVVLVEEHEPAEYGSADLLKFYTEYCGLEVIHRPIQDYGLPSVEAEKNAIDDILVKLCEGQGCLVHCFGGSGRTGTVVVGALKELGCGSPIQTARKTKSVYLHIVEQEQFIEDLCFTLRGDLVKKHPKMASALAIEHLEELWRHHDKIIVNISNASSEEVEAFAEVFKLLDHDGSGSLSIFELLSSIRSLGGHKRKDGDHAHKQAEKLTEEAHGLAEILQLLAPGQTEISIETFCKMMCATMKLSDEFLANPGLVKHDKP